MKLTDEQIATELHALRETPSEEFAAELDAWAAEGFPAGSDLASTGSAPSGRPAPPIARLGDRFRRFRERPLLPALAGAATVLLVVSVVAGLSNQEADVGNQIGTTDSLEAVEGDRPAEQAPAGAAESGGGPAARAQTESAGDAAIEPAPTTVAPGPPVPGEELKPGKDRVQEESASMTLSTEPDEVDDVADGVVDVVDRYKGIVASSNVNTADGRGRATFDLRIPTANLQAALADLSDLASVSARNEGTLDITAPFVTAEERFEDAEAEVDALLDQLADADSETEIASIREQLRGARAELAAARAELAALKQRAGFSVVSLTVVGDGDSDGWSLGDAADDAVSVLEDLAGAGLVALAVLIPLGGLTILAWLVIGKMRKRQRESALDE
jgi:hypothetical protein